MATFTGGQKVRASGVPQPYLLSAQCSSNLTMTTTTVADVVGATQTFTTVHANANVQVIGNFDALTNTTGASDALGFCYVDGAVQAQQAIWALTTAAGRAVISQTWTVTLATAGPHTIKLRGSLTANAGSCTFNSTHTGITLLVLDY